jgi:hypothetical protein
VAFTDGLPLDGDGREGSIVVQGQELADRQATPKELQFVSPRFFETLGTPIVAGTTFTWNDIYQRRRVVLVSENFARGVWGAAGAAIGKRLRPQVPLPSGASPPWFEVIGVVGDVYHDGVNQRAPEVVIFPAALLGVLPNGGGLGSNTASFVVRSDRAGTASFIDDIERAIWTVNGTVAPTKVRSLGTMYEHSMARTSLTSILLAIIGLMALALALIGVYGVVSYAVSHRRREVAIRLTLGAAPRAVRFMFVKQATVLVGFGSTVGLAAAAALTQVMEAQLFGVTPLDAPTHVSVTLGLITAAFLASYTSAHRASAVEPTEALKQE